MGFVAQHHHCETEGTMFIIGCIFRALLKLITQFRGESISTALLTTKSSKYVLSVVGGDISSHQ